MKYHQAAAVILLTAAGCMSAGSTAREKELSFEPYTGVTISGVSVESYIYARVAWVFPEEKFELITTTLRNDRSGSGYELTIKANEMGMATAISEDGYLLTAAHCIEDDEKVIVLPVMSALEHRMEGLRARLVWKSKEHDIAVIKVNLRMNCFEMSGDPPAAGADVFCGGNISSGGVSAGKIVETESLGDGFELIRHDAPLNVGDSGGPLLTHDGLLLGINLAGRVNHLTGSRTGLSLHVKPSRIDDIVRRDG